MKHRDRIQIQGENIEASEAWSQIEPPTKIEGFDMHDKLKNRIPKKEAAIRENAFIKAKQFIEQGSHEVVSSPISRSFKVKGTKQERIDIEILKGAAFI